MLQRGNAVQVVADTPALLLKYLEVQPFSVLSQTLASPRRKYAKQDGCPDKGLEKYQRSIGEVLQ